MARLPLLPTIIVGLAIATMIGLGVWQLSRAQEKETLLARYEAARNVSPLAWPQVPPGDDQLPLFRKASVMCLEPVAASVQAGRNLKGQSGYSHLVDCRTGAEGPGARVDIGWSQDPRTGAQWKGGEVSGVIAPDTEQRMKLVSATGLAGLQASAPPSPADIPNNHRSYAVQWFLFAAAALIIYALALRARIGSRNP